jgi:hypothetical protein
MERSRDHEDMAAALAEMRSAPRPAFAAELDERVAAGFPRRSSTGRPPLSVLAERFHGLSPRRLLLTTGGTALAAIAVATIVIAGVESGPEPTVVERLAAKPQPQVQFSEPMPRASTESMESSAAAVPLSGHLHRDIERSAEITLLAEPADVADDSAQVFSAVHDAGGIVLHSTTTAGENAGARFTLLIPNRNLGDALAAFSAIDEVSSRHEATTDITAPTVSLEEQLQDSRARIDGLLSQLSTAETESTRETVESELRSERRRAAALQSRLKALQRRADFSRVSLRIETGASTTTSGAGRGIDDAIDDAGQILAIAAGVTIIGLAILGPLALIGTLAWLAHRFWLQRARNRALA